MLHRHVLDACLLTASVNTDAAICLTPKVGTPLSDLIQSGSTLVEASDDAVDLTESISFNSMLKDSGGSIPHDLAMEEIVKLASDAVSTMLNVTRNVVRPIIVDQTEMLDVFLDEELKHGHRHEILPVFLENAFANPSITSLTDRYAETPVRDVLRGTALFPERDGAELLELIKTGISRIDVDIATILDDLPPEFLVNHYNHTFRGFPKPPESGLDEQAQQRIDRAGAMISFFIAKRFHEETPEGVEVSAAEFAEAVAIQMSQAGRRIYRIVSQREAFIRQQRLILSMPTASQTNRPIIVVGEVYNQYLKEGGKPEWLMGACLAGERAPTPNTLNAESEMFQRMYERAERLHKSQNNAKRVSAMVSGMRKQLLTYISAVDESDKSIIIDTKEVLRKRANEVLESVAVHANLSTYEYVRKVVCSVFFPHTQSFRILSDIDAHAAKNPSLTPREAATLTTIDLVCEWVASQIEVKRNVK